MKKIRLIFRLIQQMGWRAFIFRARYELRKRTGLLQKDFPTHVAFEAFTTLEYWQVQPIHFFFESRESFRQQENSILPDDRTAESLAVANELIQNGHVPFFNADFRFVGKDFDWLTHPETGYRYSPTQHWSKIRELDPKIGDIKFVWEKSRFAYLYPVIRHDFHSGTDHAAFVFREIEDWIAKNPLNCGPNYVCSQETSLRILNWTFALHYYKHSPELTEERFLTIMHSVYWQAQHVAANIDFSRIAVRNNHAITECLALYLIGLLYPFFPESPAWRETGKRWLTEEGLYQIYEDGSYLQFSMNYHRVVIQLFTWAFVLAERNGDHFEEKLYERLQTSLDLLIQHQDVVTGQLPNYGANDGALFFPLSSCGYRDFRPQLNALYTYFYQKPLYENGLWSEDAFWYGLAPHAPKGKAAPPAPLPRRGEKKAPPLGVGEPGGFYVLRDTAKFAFIRCGNHPDRPSQADNLHLDLWENGLNLMRDAGSYKYNTDPSTLKYFMGTASHNTVQLSDYDQMLKGGRFIWYHWSQAVHARQEESSTSIFFEGKTHVYQHVHAQIYHTRRVTQRTDQMCWEVEDQLELPNIVRQQNLPVYQRWHPHTEFSERGWHIRCVDKNGTELPLQTRQGWYSSFYGTKEPLTEWFFENKDGYFKTTIWR